MRAFTLIESLVVTAIILILSLIVFPSYRNTQQQLALQRSVDRLAQDIRRVQEMAMAATEVNGVIPQGGYGIYLRKVPSPQTSYVLFADKNNNHKYDSGAAEKIEEISFESGIKISNLNGNHLNIIFVSPDPRVYFTDADGNELVLNEAAIEISLADGTKVKTVNVNKAGLIKYE